MGLVVSILVAAAAPAGEQGLDIQSPVRRETSQPAASRKGFSIPVVTYTGEDSAIRGQGGIIAGVRLAPSTLVGVGLFEMGRKRKQANHSLGAEKRSKRAAVGISFQF